MTQRPESNDYLIPAIDSLGRHVVLKASAPEAGDFVALVIDVSGREVAIATTRPEAGDFGFVGTDTKGRSIFIRPKTVEIAYRAVVAWSADGSYMLAIADPQEDATNGLGTLFAYDPVGGTYTARASSPLFYVSPYQRDRLYVDDPGGVNEKIFLIDKNSEVRISTDGGSTFTASGTSFSATRRNLTSGNFVLITTTVVGGNDSVYDNASIYSSDGTLLHTVDSTTLYPAGTGSRELIKGLYSIDGYEVLTYGYGFRSTTKWLRHHISDDDWTTSSIRGSTVPTYGGLEYNNCVIKTDSGNAWNINGWGVLTGNGATMPYDWPYINNLLAQSDAWTDVFTSYTSILGAANQDLLPVGDFGLNTRSAIVNDFNIDTGSGLALFNHQNLTSWSSPYIYNQNKTLAFSGGVLSEIATHPASGIACCLGPDDDLTHVWGTSDGGNPCYWTLSGSTWGSPVELSLRYSASVFIDE